MKIKKFNYKKKEDDVSEREVLVLFEDDKYLMGLDFSKMTDKQKTGAILIQEKYELDLKEYFKDFYKNFLKEKIEYITEDK